MKTSPRRSHLLPPSLTVTQLFLLLLTALAVALAGGLGCVTTDYSLPLPTDGVPDRVVRIREGDLIKIAFPGSPTSDNNQQQVRVDGKITLSLGGELAAAGKTPVELEKCEGTLRGAG